MGLTRAEQETLIRWDEDSKTISVYSASPVTWRKMARLGFRPYKETTRSGQPSGKFYRLPLGDFRWGRKVTRRVGSPPHGFARRNPVKNGAPGGQTRPDGPGAA